MPLAAAALGDGLLLVEDTPSLQMLYATVLRKAGYKPMLASSGAEALQKFAEHGPRVVLLDLMLPDADGLMVMREMLELRPEARIVVITANGSVNNAIEATREGAFDFLVKPLGDIRMIGAVASAFADLQQDVSLAGDDASRNDALERAFMGRSDAMRDVHSRIAAVAASTAPVFILGESGTGKELCARAVHLKSARAAQRFVTLNCSAADPEQLEIELFGHAGQKSGRGKSAAPTRAGAIARADGGTLFLQNIQDMSLDLQSGFLRFLQNASFSPVGDTRLIKVDVRLICTASGDPTEHLRAGRLREELYYRLFVIPIAMPPLRARGGDIVLLARHYLAQIAADEGKRFRKLAPDVEDLFLRLPWQGNVRELINVLRHAVVLHDGETVTLDMLPPGLVQSAPQPRDPALPDTGDAFAGLTMAQIEERAITAAIARHGGSVPRAARELDIAPSTIYRKRESWDKS
ncbi:sigma-54-dependent transcriptional regulator [Roseibaca sp. Y0-43]|uniref:sigma-54-dependent transcriptional regulator n=1 Tax=Roseibaca sp. Y0-43 TaxID=2816854 RepID=UPI001D0BF8D5|nr:sigma-54 dependent transcriptional regulator [Roseibaca sp. Y0-43]MCC1480552.1 sigma-54-dependent Fis family transcriptional regulator [Roseibaca sp. Y0-43]